MDDSNEDDHAKTLPKEHDRDAAIDDARKAPEELGPGIPPKPVPLQ